MFNGFRKQNIIVIKAINVVSIVFRRRLYGYKFNVGHNVIRIKWRTSRMIILNIARVVSLNTKVGCFAKVYVSVY